MSPLKTQFIADIAAKASVTIQAPVQPKPVCPFVVLYFPAGLVAGEATSSLLDSFFSVAISLSLAATNFTIAGICQPSEGTGNGR
jgi:hypothetical protein